MPKKYTNKITAVLPDNMNKKMLQKVSDLHFRCYTGLELSRSFYNRRLDCHQSTDAWQFWKKFT